MVDVLEAARRGARGADGANQRRAGERRAALQKPPPRKVDHLNSLTPTLSRKRERESRREAA